MVCAIKFQYGSSKAVEGVCNTKLPIFCTEMDGNTDTPMDRQKS